jgi:hypothetical protein
METPEPEEPALFTKPAVAPAPGVDDEEDTSLGLLGGGIVVAAFVIFINLRWDQVFIADSSFAGGRNASIRRVLTHIGKLPLSIIFGLLSVVLFGSGIAQLRRHRANDRNHLANET